MTTVAEYLVEGLAQAGVEVIFGLPGGENLPLLDAMRRYGLEFVLVRNESAAVYMADVTARLTGVPGVALTTLGPGAASAYAGLAHAYLDRAPLLLITAQTDSALLPGHTHQVLDLQACFRPVTKITREVTPQNAAAAFQEALHALTAGRPGPAHLGISKQTTLAEIAPQDAATAASASDSVRAADLSQIPAAQTLLAQAQRPLIVAGLGLEPQKPYVALRQLAEVASAPVIDTPKSKGAVAASHPLFAGTIGLTRTDPVYDLLDEADCIIAIGFDVVELVKTWDAEQPLIWVAPWANDDPTIPASYEFVGAMGPVLGQLAQTEFAPADTWGTERIRTFRKQVASGSLPAPAAGRMRPHDVLDAIRAAAPPDTTITTDVGSHKIFTALHWQAQQPNRYMVSNGLSCMGFGLPAAIAATRAMREPAICITGDGGLPISIGELAALRERDWPVIIMLMNDAALDLIRLGQTRANYPVFGTEFTNPHYESIVSGYGLDYYQARDKVACVRSLEAAIDSRRPALIEVMIDPAGYTFGQ